MKKAEPNEISFVCSFDTASNHELSFSFNPSKMMKYSARKGQNTNSSSSQKQSHQTKAQKNATLRKTSSQPQRSQPQNSAKITAIQPSQSSQNQYPGQIQASSSTQQVSANSKAIINNQNQNSKNLLNLQNKNNDQISVHQNTPQQQNAQPNQPQLQPPTQSNSSSIEQSNQQISQTSQISIQKPNNNSNVIESNQNVNHSNSPEKQKQTKEPDHPTNPVQSLNIPNSSLAYKNPIYQPIFQPQKVQQSPQNQPQQPPPQPPQPPQQQQKVQPPKQNNQVQPANQVKTNQAAINQALFQQQLTLLLSSGSLQSLSGPLKLQIQVLLQQLQYQQKLKQQQQQQQQNKAQIESKSSSKKRSKSSKANDDFTLRSDNSRKSDKLFIPSSNTMYSTHHRNHKPIQDPSDTESDTYIPCSESSSSSSSSSSNEEDEEDEEMVQVKPRSTSQSHTQHTSHAASRSSHVDNSKSLKKICIKPLDPRRKLKRRYASWAEITDYGQWKWAAKDRPHIIEDPREALDRGKANIVNERSKPLEFDHEFTLLECLKVVSDDLPSLKKDVVIVSDQNENKEEMNTSNSDSNLSKSSSSSNLNAGLSKSDSIVNIFSEDKISLASVISPVITKRRAQRPNHIRLAKIIDNFDNKMRSITCRACNMLDRLLLREILKNSAPSLHQSLQQIAPYVWRDFQPDHLQSSAKPTHSSNAGSRRKKKKTVTLTAALSQSSVEVEDAFHVIKQTFEFLNICEKEETNYACEIRHMNFSQDYTFQPSFDDLVRYFRRVKGKFVSRSSSGYVLE